MLYFWKVKVKSFFITKGEIRNISGIRHSQAFIWASADINLCPQAAEVEMSVRTYPEPRVSHRGRFLSSEGALLGGTVGEAAKGSSSFAHQPSSAAGISGPGSVTGITGPGSVTGITEPCCSLQGTGKALLPQGCPSAGLRHTGHVFGGWGTLLKEEFHQLLFLLLHKKFVSSFFQNALLGFSYCTFSV